MLDENDVINAVCVHLVKIEGYVIVQKLSTTQQGIDIIVKHPQFNRRLLIEAKGGTSSKEGSNRFGKSYTMTQVFDRVSKGFFTTACMYAKDRKDTDQVALACPDNEWFRKYLNQIKSVLEFLGIKVLLVKEDRAVTYL